jgi:hypothetical protein
LITDATLHLPHPILHWFQTLLVLNNAVAACLLYVCCPQILRSLLTLQQSWLLAIKQMEKALWWKR